MDPPPVFRAHERYAVLGGPASSEAVMLPDERFAAIAFRQAHHDQLWCGVRAGGCGQRLLVKAGEIRDPYLSHEPGASIACPMSGHPSRAREGYQHLALQRALQTWLTEQGLTAVLEQPVDGGRLDVHVVAGGNAHALEVQRSPLTTHKRRARERLYLNSVRTVTWLWDPSLESRWVDHVIEADVAHLIAIDNALTVEIGTASLDGDRPRLDWTPLRDCSLDELGMWTPHREDARARTQRSRRAADLQTAAQQRIPARPRPPEGPRTLRPQRVLERERPHHRWWDTWSPTQGTAWLLELPEQLREAAWHHAHYVTLSQSGHVVDLEFVDCPDPDRLVAAALVKHGFLMVDHATGRWETIRAQPR